MSVEVPLSDPGPAQHGYVGGPLDSAIPQSIAVKENWLHGNHYLRLRNIIIQPFRALPDQPYGVDEVRYIPFRTSSRNKGLFVALAVSNVRPGGSVTLSVREAPAFADGQATPGSGDLIDPGCQWLQATQTLPEPVVDGRWAVTTPGPLWLHTGILAPPAIDLEGDPSPVPRTLKAPGAQDIEIKVEWTLVGLCTICVLEKLQERIG